jgi:2-oxoglutarate dehydrogenase E2 component (dihydrolipoamide succinyltransferase)
MDENSLNIDDILNGLKKISTKEVKLVIQNKVPPTKPTFVGISDRPEKREHMSQLRRKLSKRLVAVKNETAMLTTFNELDMGQVIALRTKFQKQFTEKHGLKLGFMSFFVKAATEALTLYPRVNSQIDGEEIVVPGYVDIAIAVQTDKGLMVPVLRDTQSMGIAQIEKNISMLADKARTFKLSIEEMTGGTFTITNGGVFGSMLSTPILNPPQSAILGMHNITERPVAVKGKVEIRPMMYVALSYDHRIIDGKDSVSFLVKMKELLEAPNELLFNSQDPEKILLGL